MSDFQSSLGFHWHELDERLRVNRYRCWSSFLVIACIARPQSESWSLRTSAVLELKLSGGSATGPKKSRYDRPIHSEISRPKICSRGFSRTLAEMSGLLRLVL